MYIYYMLYVYIGTKISAVTWQSVYEDYSSRHKLLSKKSSSVLLVKE